MGERETGSHERHVVSKVVDGELDLSGETLDSLEAQLAAETGSETWAAGNVGPFYLMGTVMDLTDRMAAVDGLPSVERVGAWRDELDAAVDVADDAWGTPTVAIAEFVPEAAGELRSMLSELVELLEEHRGHVADLGADDPNVERHRRLVREYLETTIRATRLFDDGDRDP